MRLPVVVVMETAQYGVVHDLHSSVDRLVEPLAEIQSPNEPVIRDAPGSPPPQPEA